MDNTRLFLWGAFAFVLYLLYTAWVEDHAPKPVPMQTVASEPAPLVPVAPDVGAPPAAAAPVAPADVVSAAPAAANTPAPEAVDAPSGTPAAVGELVRIRTDVIDAVIDTRGADLVALDLLTFPKHKDTPDDPIRIVGETAGGVIQPQTGLRSAGVALDQTLTFTTEAREYALADGSDTLVVAFTATREDGLAIEKRYTFHRGDHLIDLEWRVVNNGSAPWQGDAFVQFQQRYQEIERSIFSTEGYSFTGPAIHDGKKYRKLPFDEIGEEPLTETITGGWAALLQHWFMAAAIPPADQKLAYYTRDLGQARYLVGYVLPAQELAAGGQGTWSSKLWIGPKTQDRIEDIAPGLELAVDYGMLTLFAKPLFWVLEWFHKLTGNWGWAIILLTIAIKLVFYKLSETSGRSMAKMRKVTPRLQQLKERYKDDRMKLNEAMLEMYKKEKINPAAGCLPILIQLPVFIALYWVLLESVEMRQAPWALWIQDLSSRDPYFVLPLLMGIAMWIQMKLNPAPPDEIQAKVMMMMPIIMTAFSAFFPSGLVLYWFVNTALSVAQQWQINKVVEADDRRN
jgi:YidC/Oxa1 family membrane protein insertase